MDDKELDLIVDNEREWRRHMLLKIDHIETEQGKLKEEFAAFRVWLWVGRFIVITCFGGLVTWIKAHTQ